MYDKLGSIKQLSDLLGYNAPKEINNTNINADVSLTPEQKQILEDKTDEQY